MADDKKRDGLNQQRNEQAKPDRSKEIAKDHGTRDHSTRHDIRESTDWDKPPPPPKPKK